MGSALTNVLLGKGYSVIILSRKNNQKTTTPNLSYAHWDIKKQQIDEDAIKQADFIVHLAGAGVVAKKWTAAYKKEIVESRTESSRLIVDSLQRIENNVKAIISASAIGFYGSDNENGKPFVETDNADESFLGNTCKIWEESIDPVTKLNKRLVKLRTGIVLSNDGGALIEFKKPLQFGIAAILGSGKQIVSWIHIDDLCRLFIEGIEHDKLEGTYNAVAPLPVSNKTLTLTLAKAMNGKFYFPMKVPSFILNLMMGKRSIEVLKSTTVSCQKILDTGFAFEFKSIERALAGLIKK